MVNLLQKAIDIAINAHSGQTDKYSQPYALHIMRVMLAGKTLNEQIVGILHDLVEDTHWTLEALANEGFPEEIIAAIDLLTHTAQTTYEDFIQKIKTSGNKLAINVKLHDLRDNMDILRLDEVKEKDIPRLNKYLKAYRELITEK